MSDVTSRTSPLRIGFLAFVEHSGVSGAHSGGLREGFRLFESAEALGYDAAGSAPGTSSSSWCCPSVTTRRSRTESSRR
jgi:hypothetical protein